MSSRLPTSNMLATGSIASGSLVSPATETEEALLAFPELKELAADAATLEPAAARALFTADLTARWQRGEGLPAEIYWDLAGDWGDEETLWQIVAAELAAWRETGATSELETWIARFPLVAARLTESWQDRAAQVEAPVGPRTPEWIAEFEVLLELPSPGRNRWFAVRDPHQQRELVLELGCEPIAVNHRWRERVEHDLNESAALDAPQLPHVQAWGWYQDRPFIVREYVAGVALPDWIRFQHASRAQLINMVSAVAKVLAMAHRRGVLHLALTPGHILVDERGRPHLLGLGTGLVSHADASQADSTLPPELASNSADRCGPRFDVYSLGSILVELLTGFAPQGASDPILTGPALDEDLQRIATRALDSDPKERYASADDFATELEALGHQDAMLGSMLVPSLAAVGLVLVFAALTWLYQSGALAGLLAQ